MNGAQPRAAISPDTVVEITAAEYNALLAVLQASVSYTEFIIPGGFHESSVMASAKHRLQSAFLDPALEGVLRA